MSDSDSLEGIFDEDSGDNDETNNSGSGTTPLLPPGTKKKSEESSRWSQMTYKQKRKKLKRIAQYKRRIIRLYCAIPFSCFRFCLSVI